MMHPPQPKTVELHPKAFKRMKNLKFLVVANVHVRRGFTYLPRQLRLLDWPDYPFSLPSNFFPEHLVALNMPRSNIGLKSLFSQGIEFEYLQHINLKCCESITELPELRTSNLKELDLSGCTNLVKVHQSVGSLSKLECLDLSSCRKLQILPSNLMLKSLQYFDLDGCLRLEKFPNIQPGMDSLQVLHMQETAIRELPSSFGFLIGLEELFLSCCHNLMALPNSIYKLQHLNKLWISNCTNLKIDRGPMYNSFHGSSEYGFLRLEELDLSYCENLIELDFFMIPVYFPTLKNLSLCGTNIVTIPKSISRFASLKTLAVKNCMQLREVPRLPESITFVDATNCMSLDSQSSTQFGEIQGLLPNIICEGARSDILITPKSSIQLLHQDVATSLSLSPFQDFGFPKDIFQIILPGTMIPRWFNHQTTGNSISFLVGHKFPNFAVCIAFGLEGLMGKFFCHVYISINGFKKLLHQFEYDGNMADHLWLMYTPYKELQNRVKKLNLCDQNHVEILCKIHPKIIASETSIIKRCGVHVACICHPQKSGTFHEYCKNVDGGSQQERYHAVLNIKNISKTKIISLSEPEAQYQCHSNIVSSCLNECEGTKTAATNFLEPLTAKDINGHENIEVSSFTGPELQDGCIRLDKMLNETSRDNQSLASKSLELQDETEGDEQLEQEPGENLQEQEEKGEKEDREEEKEKKKIETEKEKRDEERKKQEEMRRKEEEREKNREEKEKEERLNRLETELKKKKEKERQNQGATDNTVEENEGSNLESSEAKGIQEYTHSSGKALALQDSGDTNLDLSVPAKESHNGVHSPISSGALEVSNVGAIPISLSTLIATIGLASGVSVFLQEVDHDQLVEDVSKIIKKWNTPVRTTSIGDTSCISSDQLKQTLELLNKYLSIPITQAILDLDTKQHFEALSSFLLPHIQKKDKNKWMMLSVFIKSIDTTASQLSQAKHTWEQADKLLLDHNLKLTAHNKYKSQLQTANTKLAEASQAEKQKERELKEVQKQLEVLRQNRIMAHSHLQHLLLQKDSADEASESLSKSEEEITTLQDGVTALTECNRIAWECLRDAFKDFDFDQ